MIQRPRTLLTVLPLMLCACAIGPNYVRPGVEAPAAYKELDGWKRAQPNDADLRGAWWQAYADPLLDALMPQVSDANQTLAQAAARYRQARARWCKAHAPAIIRPPDG